jgi:hypothetical protein
VVTTRGAELGAPHAAKERVELEDATAVATPSFVMVGSHCLR